MLLACKKFPTLSTIFCEGLQVRGPSLYNQSKTDTSIDDFRLATARLMAAPLYSGLAAIGGVLVVQQNLALNVANILIAAAFGLTPSLLTSAIQKEADQYKTDLKSTAATAPTKEKQKCALSNNDFPRCQITLPLSEFEWRSLKRVLCQHSLPKVPFATYRLPTGFFTCWPSVKAYQ